MKKGPIKHGLFVRGAKGLRLRDQSVTRLVGRMKIIMPWLTESDLAAARAWAETEVLCERIYADLRDRGITNKKTGDARRVLDEYRKLRLAQAVLARELGLTPASRQALQAGSTQAALDLPAQLARRDEEIIPDGSTDKD